MTAVIVSDLVPLKERGLYNGLIGMYVVCLLTWSHRRQ